MLTRIISYGLIGAVIVGTLMYTGSLGWASGDHQPTSSGVIVGYATQLIALIFVFLGVKAHRDNALGGVIKFLPAFGIGLAISAIASLGWVISWEFVLAMTNFDVGAMMKDQMLSEATARGAPEAEIQKITADAAAFSEMYKNPLFRWPMSFIEMFPVGVLVSLISAAVLRNSSFLPANRAAMQG
jgi:hypothetical protein